MFTIHFCKSKYLNYKPIVIKQNADNFDSQIRGYHCGLTNNSFQLIDIIATRNISKHAFTLQENLKVDYFKNLPTSLALYEKRLGDNPWFAGDKVIKCER